MVRLYNGVPLAMDEHVARLEQSCRKLRLRVDIQALREDVERVIRRTRRAIRVTDGKLYPTPLADRVFASITRSLVIELTGASGRRVKLAELYAADEAFLASTTKEVRPITAVDDHEFPSTHPVTDRTRSLVLGRIRLIGGDLSHERALANLAGAEHGDCAALGQRVHEIATKMSRK